MDATSAQDALTQAGIKAIRLGNPAAWANMSPEEEGLRLRELEADITRVLVLRGHATNLEEEPAVIPSEAAVDDDTDVWIDAEEGMEGEGVEEAAAEEDVAAPPAPAPAAAAAPVLHPTHIIKYNYDWRTVHTDASGRQFVCAELDGGIRFVDKCVPNTRRTCTPVAPPPPTEDIQRFSARPSGTFLLKGGVFHAVFLGPRGGRFVIVGGAKKWVANRDPVRLLVTEHDRTAMGAAAEE